MSGLALPARSGIAPAMVSTVVLASVAISIAMLVRGWLYSDMVAKIPWAPDGLPRLALVCGIYWAAYVLVVVTGRSALPLKLLGLGLFAVAVVIPAVPVLSVLLLLGASCAVGALLAGRRIGVSSIGDLALVTTVGLAVYAVVLPILGRWPVNGSWSYLLLLGAPIAAAWRRLPAVLRPLLARADLGVVEVVLLGVVGNFAVIFGLVAALPEIGHDALGLHLHVAAQVREVGHWHYDPARHLFAVIPMGGAFLHGAAYMFGGEAAARLQNVATLLLLLAVVYGAVRARGPRSFALLATLVAASTPLALAEASSLFIDNAWALFLVASVAAILRFEDDPRPGFLDAAALLFGAAMSTKLISVALVPALLLVLAMRWRAWFPTRIAAVRVLAIACVASAPPYVMALLASGNPVFPFYNALFASPFYPAVNFANPKFPGSFDPAVFYRMTFYSDAHVEGLPGSFGFSFLLLLLPVTAWAGLAGRRTERFLLLLLLTFLVVVTGMTAYARYLYPAGFLLAILLGRLLASPSAAGITTRGSVAVAALLSVTLNAAFLSSPAAQVRSFDLPAMVDPHARLEYVRTWAPVRELVDVLNAQDGVPGAVALLGTAPMLAQIDRAAFTNTSYMRGFMKHLEQATSVERFREMIRDLDIAFFVLEGHVSPDLVARVQATATPVYRAGAATLYRVDTRVRFPVAREAGIPFAPGLPGWTQVGNVVLDEATGAVRVSVGDLLYQTIPASGGETYRLAVEARCAEQRTEYRLQVFWLNKEGRSLDLDLLTVPCTPDWKEESALLRAPPTTHLAVVYATGHDAVHVLVRRVSFSARR